MTVRQQKIVIFGAGIFAELLNETITQYGKLSNVDILGFTVDDQFYSGKIFCGKPVWRYSELRETVPSEIEILIGIGYSSMNQNRRDVFMRLKRDGYPIASYIDPQAVIRTQDIGTGNIFLESVNIGVRCHIGDGNVFFPRSLLAHHSFVDNFNFFSVNATVAGNTRIGECCFFGAGSTVRDNVVVPTGTLVGGGGYISNNVERPGRVFVPARNVMLGKSSSEVRL